MKKRRTGDSARKAARPSIPSSEPATTPKADKAPLNWLLPVWPLILLGAVFAALTAWSWRKWPDVEIDYGQQLYFPWQIASGKVMFRDLEYISGGPLSQYFHALMFKLFGVSFTTLVVVNLVLLALFVLLLYRLFLRAADEWTALMACLVTLCAFAFPQFTNIANYNYICPYAYEAFHGLVLSVAALASFWRGLLTSRKGWLFACGLCAGGVFLTKPELFVALAAALAAGAIVRGPGRGGPPRLTLRASVALLPGFAVPITAFFAYYLVVWNFSGALKGVGGSWVPLLTTQVTHNQLYQWSLGLDHPAANLLLMARRFGGFVTGLGCVAAFCRRYQRGNVPIRAALGVVLVVMWWWSVTQFRWSRCGSALAPITLLGLAWTGWKWWKSRRTPGTGALVFPLVWSVFALVLLAKLGLMTRIWQFGFYLAMPAALFAIWLLFGMLPRELEPRLINARLFRALTTVFVLTALAQMLWESNLFYRDKRFAVGGGADEILAVDPKLDSRGLAFAETAAWIDQNTATSATIAALPEGTLINYLTRRPNPTPYVDFMPAEMEIYGERRMLEACIQRPPDYVILVHRDSSDWKLNYFGQDPGYGLDVMQWVRANYVPVWGLGPEPLQSRRFGIRVLKRKTAEASH